MIITKALIHLTSEQGKDGRPVLATAHFDAEQGRLETCNGFTLASVPVKLDEGEEVGDCLIPMAAIREAQKLGNAKSKSPALSIEGGKVRVAGISDAEVVEGGEYDIPDLPPYPNTEQIRPHTSGLKHLCAIDIRRLYDLARAICEDPDNSSKADLFVNLYQGDSNSSPIVVEPLGDGSSFRSVNRKCRKGHTPNYDDGPWGLIMPLYHE